MNKLNVTQAAKICIRSALYHAYWEDEIDSNFDQVTPGQRKEILSEIKHIETQSIEYYLKEGG